MGHGSSTGLATKSADAPWLPWDGVDSEVVLDPQLKLYQKKLDDKAKWLKVAKLKGMGLAAIFTAGGFIATIPLGGGIPGGAAAGAAATKHAMDTMKPYIDAWNEAKTFFDLAAAKEPGKERDDLLQKVDIALGRMR